jgi:uncharacterized membrane protein
MANKMKPSILSLLLVMLAGNSASADVIHCLFTEPFVATTYQMSRQTLTIREYSETPKVIRNVSFQIKGPSSFELVSSDGKVLQELNLNRKGSDGMSDNLYPYDVKDFSIQSGARFLFGGCSSNHLKVEPGNP